MKNPLSKYIKPSDDITRKAKEISNRPILSPLKSKNQSLVHTAEDIAALMLGSEKPLQPTHALNPVNSIFAAGSIMAKAFSSSMRAQAFNALANSSQPLSLSGYGGIGTVAPNFKIGVVSRPVEFLVQTLLLNDELYLFWRKDKVNIRYGVSVSYGNLIELSKDSIEFPEETEVPVQVVNELLHIIGNRHKKRMIRV
jgi:hypothetical protein